MGLPTTTQLVCSLAIVVIAIVMRRMKHEPSHDEIMGAVFVQAVLGIAGGISGVVHAAHEYPDDSAFPLLCTGVLWFHAVRCVHSFIAAKVAKNRLESAIEDARVRAQWKTSTETEES